MSKLERDVPSTTIERYYICDWCKKEGTDLEEYTSPDKILHFHNKCMKQILSTNK